MDTVSACLHFEMIALSSNTSSAGEAGQFKPLTALAHQPSAWPVGYFWVYFRTRVVFVATNRTKRINKLSPGHYVNLVWRVKFNSCPGCIEGHKPQDRWKMCICRLCCLHHHKKTPKSCSSCDQQILKCKTGYSRVNKRNMLKIKCVFFFFHANAFQ